VSRKSERLVNLTIALLATKRYLTKSEIFQTVAGYTGDPEARDRMFERDKDDLRKLGIVIELGTFDPLFEDEAGYRIKPESYAIQLNTLTPTQLTLLSQASAAWKEASLGEAAHSGLRKLKSLGIDSDIATLPDISIALPTPPEQVADLIEAVTQRRSITFEYLNDELKTEVRHVQPFKLSHAKSRWYLIARDVDKSALRTFRVDRFASAISFSSQPASYEIDKQALAAEEAKRSQAPHLARIAIRKGRGAEIRSHSIVSDLDDEWDEVEVSYFDAEVLLRQILWLRDDAKILEPKSLRDQLIEVVKVTVALHG
jgi:proteasome accessory factor B